MRCDRCKRDLTADYFVRAGMTPRLSRMLDLRVGKTTYKEIGEEFGLSIERSRQLVARALKIVRGAVDIG